MVIRNTHVNEETMRHPSPLPLACLAALMLLPACSGDDSIGSGGSSVEVGCATDDEGY